MYLCIYVCIVLGRLSNLPNRTRRANENIAHLLSPSGGTVVCNGSSKSSPPVSVSLALRWSSDSYSETILSFCNNIRTKDGGSHVDGLKNCLTRTVNQCAIKAGKVRTSERGAKRRGRVF